MKKRKAPKRKQIRAVRHPQWEEWINEAGFVRIEDAYRALGLTRGTFYRSIRNPPELTVALAMAALAHRIRPYGE